MKCKDIYNYDIQDVAYIVRLLCYALNVSPSGLKIFVQQHSVYFLHV